MIHPTPTTVLLTTTCEPLVRQLSGSLARGVRRIDQFVHDEPTPQKMMTCERDLRLLLRDVGRRIMAWVLNRWEPKTDEETPPRGQCEGPLYRRRQKHPRALAPLFGPVEVWRRLYEPLQREGRSMHPLERRLGIEAGGAPPALAERGGRWSTDHTQQEVRELLEKDHGVPWSCTSLRHMRGSLRRGMAPHRQACQGEQVGRWRAQAHPSQGRFRPTRSVGRDGMFVPLLRGVAQAGATAPVSVWDRRGKRLGTVSLGPMPEAGQGTLTAQLSALLRDMLSRVDSQGLRLVSVTDEGSPPSDSSHRVLKKMTDPRRPWRRLEWRRSLDCSPACPSLQHLAAAMFGTGTEAQRGAKQMRHV